MPCAEQVEVRGTLTKNRTGKKKRGRTISLLFYQTSRIGLNSKSGPGGLIMTLDQLDQLLAEWKHRTESATAGLLALRALPTYEILTGGQCQLTGITAQKAAPALRSLEGAWLDYGRIATAVDQAHALRTSMPRFAGVQQKIDEIAALLTNSTTADSASPDGNLAIRDLHAHSAAPALPLLELFDRMNTAFIHARDVILGIAAAWESLDTGLPPARRFVEEHADETAFGIPALRHALDELKPRVLPDPLGAADQFRREISPRLAEARAAIAELDRRRADFGPNLALAHAMLERLIALHAQSEAAYAEHREKLTDCASGELPVSGQRISQVTARMGQIPGKSITAFVCNELDECLKELGNLTSLEQQILSKNRAPLELRRELRGRLSALKAKAVGRGRAEDRDLGALSTLADQLLYSRPTPLNQALATVAQYEGRLNNPERR